ncbi:MAG: hypothetical protein WBB07_02385 [Mycobacterium sp.]
MTASIARSDSATDSLLRSALRWDAVVTGLGGLALATAAFLWPDHLQSSTGFTPAQEYVVGVALVFYGVVVFRLAGLEMMGPARFRPRPSGSATGLESVRRAGIGVIVANLVCTTAAITIVVSGWLPLTALGVTVLWFSATYTTGFAIAQYVGVRRMA